MRIIAGSAKGTILETPETAEISKGGDTRPTLDRVKENFFNAINFELPNAKILDLFSGSGQLGLEALSRGAMEAVFVDTSPECIETITRNAQKAKLYNKCNIIKSDYETYLSGLKKRKNPKKFDLIFLDPPYSSGKKIIGECINKIIKNELVSNGGQIICETGNGEKLNLALDEDTAERIKNSRAYKYGKVYITILAIKGEDDG